jgi:hypothetical protein
MLPVQDIQSNLQSLDQQFQTSSSPSELQFCAKLAVIELCGWIEEAMDEIVLRCSSRCLRVQDNVNYCQKTIVSKNFGFEYDGNFRKMLIQLIGLAGVEKVESAADQGKLSFLNTELSNLKTIRNRVAHTYTPANVQLTLTAPSTLLPKLATIFDGLSEIDREISARNW